MKPMRMYGYESASAARNAAYYVQGRQSCPKCRGNQFMHSYKPLRW